MTKSKHGYVIALDGPDGVGKTTQLKLLADARKQKGLVVHTTRSSGGTPIGEELRKVSLSDTPRPPETDLYISLAMGTALAEDIQKRKQRHEVVLIDRSPLAIIAYNAYGSQLHDKKTAFDACEMLCASWQIDLLIFFNAPQTVLDQRRRKRDTSDYFERQSKEYHQRVREGYQAGLKFLQGHPAFGPKVAMIEASDNIQAIHRKVLEAIDRLGL